MFDKTRKSFQFLKKTVAICWTPMYRNFRCHEGPDSNWAKDDIFPKPVETGIPRLGQTLELRPPKICTGGNPKSLAAGKKGCLDTLFLNGSIVGLAANSTAIQLSLKDGIQKTIWWLEQGWVFCGLKLLRYFFFWISKHYVNTRNKHNWRDSTGPVAARNTTKPKLEMKRDETKPPDVYMGVSKNRGTPNWMVYNGKPY